MARTVSAVPMLARRFLLSKVSDKFLSFIAWVSVVGVALGVLALTVVTSVINGFEGELTRVITGMNGDVVLFSRGEPISDPAAIERKIRKVLPQAREVTPSFVAEIMTSGPSGVAGSVLEGLDLETVGRVTAVPERLIAGRLPEAAREVAVTSALAERIGVTEGDEIRLILPFTGAGEEGGSLGSPKVVKARVVGIVRMGMHEYDSKFIFATLPEVQDFVQQPGKVTSFKIRLSPGTDTRKASDQLSDSFGYPFRAKDWSQLNKNLLYAIRLEKVVIGIILTIIVVVAAFNVVSTLMMMIHDKTSEIAILKAMGLRKAQSFGLFSMIGLGMGVVGTFFGIVIGLGVNQIIRHTRLIDLPPEIYYIGFLPVVVKWSEIGWIALVAILIAFLATLYPAWMVARRSPLEGLRYE